MPHPRYALLEGSVPQIETIRRYMPANYTADAIDDDVVIYGLDNAGWTLDGYVIPRLASGLHFAREITREEADKLGVIA